MASWSKRFLVGYAWWQGIAVAAFLVASAASTTDAGQFALLLLLFLALVPSCALPPIAALPVIFMALREETPCRWSWGLVMALFMAVPLWFGAGCLGAWMHMRKFEQLAERSKPLIAAVRAYEQERGQPPPDLQALVPAYLAEVPGTGMSAYPDYNYFVGADASTRWYGNPWALSVGASYGMMDFSYFYYLPLQNYPATQSDGAPERIGEWVYLHE